MAFVGNTFSKLYNWIGGKTDTPRKNAINLNAEFQNFADGLSTLAGNRAALAGADFTGNITTTGTIGGKLPSYAIAELPDASSSGAGYMVYVTDDVGGATPAFSDGTTWKRVADLAEVSTT